MLYHWATRALWCPEPESNQWHVDFQSTALPTELSGRKNIFMKLPETGIEPVRVLPRRILSPVRLPIPPLGQILRCFSRSITIPNQPKFVNSFFRFFSFFHHQSLGKKKNKYLYLFWKWAEKDSNLRSYRNRFTVCPLWPLGNPPMVMESFFDYELPSHDALGIVQGSEWKMMEWFSSVKKKNRP